jgi:hypothetical protein
MGFLRPARRRSIEDGIEGTARPPSRAVLWVELGKRSACGHQGLKHFSRFRVHSQEIAQISREQDDAAET